MAEKSQVIIIQTTGADFFCFLGQRTNSLPPRDRPKRLFLVTAVTETGAEIQLLVLAVTVTRPKLTNDLRL